MTDLMREEILRTYDVREQIGEGSGGIVYKAYHRRLRKMVVLKKIIDPGYSAERNRQEVDILKNINHSYLPHVLDFFETSEGVYTVMDFIPGKSLSQYMKEGVRFAKEDLLKWGMQICSALHYLHTRQIPIIHGDIKPSNIMLKPDGDICLIDFNISFYFNRDTVLGCTRGYSSPEQLWAVSSMKKRQEVPFAIDNKADIYSVGATLYYLATGRARTDYSQPIDTDQLAACVGWPFAQVIAKAVDLDPAGRYQSAYEMFQALKRVPEQSRRILKEKRRISRKAILAAVCAAVILCAGAGGIVAWQKHKAGEYNDKIEKARDLIESREYEEARDVCGEAIDLIDDNAEGYYWKDYTYFEEGDFSRCSRELEEDIDKVDKKSAREDSQRSFTDLCCLQGRAYLEQEKSGEAVTAFADAEDYANGQLTADQYRDYAVALARDGQTDKAEEKIDQAGRAADEGRGDLADYAISYTRGEILAEDGDKTDALAEFRDAARGMRDRKLSEEDQYLQYRTYMAMYDIHNGRNDWPACIQVLEEADDEVDSAWEGSIRRKLGEAYYNNKEFSIAGNRYELVLTENRGGWTDFKSAAEAYRRAEDPDAIFGLADMYDRRQDGTEFGYWFLMAIGEMNRQSLRPNGYADYTLFREYYSKAMNASQKTPGEYQEEIAILNEDYSRIQ